MHVNDKLQEDPRSRVRALLDELGVDAGFMETCRMPLLRECNNLVETELDVFGRQPLLDAEAFAAWSAMRAAALAEGIHLQIVSAYRSIEYQKQLFLRKLARGDRITDILQVNAAPGYSEHHSGCALDISTPGFAHLETEFERSPAFTWLLEHAEKFGFQLSFPRGNPYGVQYEPWHWCYRSKNVKQL